MKKKPKINVLVLGPEFYGYTRSIGKAFEMLGAKVSCIEYDLFFSVGTIKIRRSDIPVLGSISERSALQGFRETAIAHVRSRPIDLILIVRPDRINSETLARLRDICPNTFICAWFLDPWLRYPLSDQAVLFYDAVFFYDRSDLISQGGRIRNAFSLPAAFDHLEFNYAPGALEKRYEFCFIGSLNPSRTELIARLYEHLAHGPRSVWVSVGKRRTAKGLLRALASRESRHMRFPVRYVDSIGRDAAGVYNSSTACLNNHQAGTKEGLNPRVFEIPGSGGVQVCDAVSGIENYFEPDREIILYSSWEELLMKYDRLKSDKKLRNRVARAGSRRAHAEHTFKHRMSEVRDILFK